jgi:hypothetical protein
MGYDWRVNEEGICEGDVLLLLPGALASDV